MSRTAMLEEKRVPAEALRREIDPGQLGFATTAEIEPLAGTIGQERALEAIRTGIQMGPCGFNIFACGPVGTGRNTTVRTLVEEAARGRPTPNDWCYVHDFDSGEKPQALELPPGKGRELAADMEELVEDCRAEIARAFEEEEYEKQKNEVLTGLHENRTQLLNDLKERAEQLDHALRVTPAGIFAVPLVDGEAVSQEEFDRLDDEQKQDLREKGAQVQHLIAQAVARGRQHEKEAKKQTRELDRKVGLFAVGHLVDELAEKYGDFPEVVGYLRKVKDDILENIGLFRNADDQHVQIGNMKVPIRHAATKYHVNAVVDNGDTEGAPVIDERNPNYYNLLGQLQYRSQMGSMVTDFTMIKAGAMQRAQGGFLILQVLDVLRNPFAWEGLKRAIRTGKAKIENAWESYFPTPTATLRPEPIPVDVKVILVGSRLIYHLLYMLDEDFRRLFKIKADFDVEMDLTDEHLSRYARFVATRCTEGEAPAFDQGAVARVAEYGMRLAAHQERLSTEFLYVSDLVAEACQRARSAEADHVTADHVDGAIEACRTRSRMIQDKVQRMIEEDALLVDTTGAITGQVNGLSVYLLGDYAFGKPSRITCVTSIGRAGVVNIERESKMSGRIHDKGVLILTGYLASRFGQDKPLSLSARLCFEQSYGQVEGDSASCAELYCLLSSLADLPLRQDIAATGSVNQRGQVQPIGGVNEKIEGFFEVCRRKGLTGEQGVLIPRRNLKHLMVKPEVVQAVRDGTFHVYAVGTVEEGIEILTGMPAGEAGEEGYPEKSVFGRVDRRLREMADVLKQFGHFPPEEGGRASPAGEEEAPPGGGPPTPGG